ncbi:MAG TPA: DUF3471 domain-containing protein [Gemmatimonadales bacterium]|nr:DUF3471 domain-containing protein [Gemmatimonadales bacterium]
MQRTLLILATAGLLAPNWTDQAFGQQPPRAIRRTIPITNMIQRAHQAGTRDSTGRPGPNYWQTSVDYRIHASLDPATSIVTGRETIVLHNNSPEAMRDIYFRLDQNIFAQNSPRNRSVSEITSGMNVTSLTIDGQTIDLTTPAARGEGGFRRPSGPPTEPTAHNFNTTSARVRLSTPVAAHGSATLDIEWQFQVPLIPSGRGLRMGRSADTVYQVAQWYPRVAVYDDYKGWDTDPYLGSAEFYNNFGHFDVTYEVPAGWIVGATGVLQNPDEVLTEAERARLATVLESDNQIHVVDPDSLGPGRSTAPGTRLRWHFVADSVADVAWATSKSYAWDATRANIPGKGYIPVHILYLPGHEAAPHHFDQVGERVRHALEFYSQLWMPYAFPQLTVADGPELGMEYPMFIMSALGAADHEVGHEWWPMMVGVNETWWGFMDEGFNQYMNILSSNDRNHRAPDAGLDGPGQSYGQMSGNEQEPPLMWDENYAGPMYGFVAYGKAPMMLSMLGGIVGDSAVWRAHSAYAHAWRFKHPTPWDYAFFMNTALHQDLGWFWYYWLWTTESVDASLQKVTTQGPHTVVTVRQDGEMPSPVVLQVEFEPTGPAIVAMTNSVMTDSTTALVTFPVDVWFNGGRTFDADLEFGGRQIAKITLDPHKRFPDRNPRDNVWPQPKPVHLSQAVLDRHVGTYQVPGLGELVITREDTTLWAQPTGQDRVQLWPTSETEFYLTEAAVQITFRTDAGGNTTALVIHQGGQEIEAQRSSATLP